MVRTAKVLFCDNEHGTGDVSFPDLVRSPGEDLAQHFISYVDARKLRQEAKKNGWSYIDGHDYCAMCTEGNRS